MDGDQTGAATATQEPPERTDETPAKRSPRRGRANQTGEAPASVRVTYEDLDEFLGELALHVASVADAVVRATVREQPRGTGYVQRELQLVAGYVLRGQVRELVWSSQPYWGNAGEPTKEATDELAPQMETLRTTVDVGGLELRAGRFGAL